MCKYSIRFSKKAKYLRLSVSAQKGIEVVVPAHVSKTQARKMAQQFVWDKQAWLEKTLRRLNFCSEESSQKAIILPKKIHLKALEQELKVSYQNDFSGRFQVQQDIANDLLVSGDINNKQMVLESLQVYLKQIAKAFFPQRLDFFCQKYALSYNRLTIRSQKTRWGSCSSKKNINLNYKLLFIESSLADYVLLHELAHTKHLNHSPQFWAFLEQLCENSKVFDKRLNMVGKELPAWLNY